MASGGMKSRTVFFVLCCEMLSLAFFCIPQTLSWVGLIPGVLLIYLVDGTLYYTGYAIWQFCMRYRGIARSMADCLEIVFGSLGGRGGLVMSLLFMTFVVAAHIDGFESAMNFMAEFKHSSAVYKVVGMLLILAMGIPRTMGKIHWFYAFSFVSFMFAAVVGLIGVTKAFPHHDNWDLVTASNLTSPAKAGQTVSFLIVASMAHNALPTIINEMENPEEFPQALRAFYVTNAVLESVFAVLFYVYAGDDIENQAMASGMTKWAKASYGLALPTILLAAVIAQMVAAKDAHRVLSGWFNKKNGNRRSRVIWWVCSAVIGGSALGLAFGIKKSDQVFSLIGSLVGNWFALGFPSMLWFYINLRDVDDNGQVEEKEQPTSDPRRDLNNARLYSSTSNIISDVEKAYIPPAPLSRAVSEPGSSARTSNGSIPSTQAILNQMTLRRNETSRLSSRFFTFCKRFKAHCVDICKRFPVLLRKKKVMTTLHMFIVLICIGIGVLGTYGAVEDIRTNGHKSFEVLG